MVQRKLERHKDIAMFGGTFFGVVFTQCATSTARGQPQTVEQAAEPREYVGRENNITGLVKGKSIYDLVGQYFCSTP